MPMFSFNGEVVWPIVTVEVPVHIGPVKKTVEFIMLNIDFPHNAILGRNWLRQMQAIASPYHQKLKFP